MYKIRIKELPNKKEGGEQISKTLPPVDVKKANLEAEKGETVAGDLNGDTFIEFMTVGGKPHSQGGTPLNIPEGSFIFSNTKDLRIKDDNLLKEMFGLNPKKGKGWTPADISKKYDFNQYVDILKDSEVSAIEERSAKKMVENNLEKLGQLALIQESMKGFPDGVPAISESVMAGMNITPDMILPQGQDQSNETQYAREGGIKKAQYGNNPAQKSFDHIKNLMDGTSEQQAENVERMKDFVKNKEEGLPAEFSKHYPTISKGFPNKAMAEKYRKAAESNENIDNKYVYDAFINAFNNGENVQGAIDYIENADFETFPGGVRKFLSGINYPGFEAETITAQDMTDNLSKILKTKHAKTIQRDDPKYKKAQEYRKSYWNLYEGSLKQAESLPENTLEEKKLKKQALKKAHYYGDVLRKYPKALTTIYSEKSPGEIGQDEYSKKVYFDEVVSKEHSRALDLDDDFTLSSVLNATENIKNTFIPSDKGLDSGYNPNSLIDYESEDVETDSTQIIMDMMSGDFAAKYKPGGQVKDSVGGKTYTQNPNNKTWTITDDKTGKVSKPISNKEFGIAWKKMYPGKPLPSSSSKASSKTSNPKTKNVKGYIAGEKIPAKHSKFLTWNPSTKQYTLSIPKGAVYEEANDVMNWMNEGDKYPHVMQHSTSKSGPGAKFFGNLTPQLFEEKYARAVLGDEEAKKMTEQQRRDLFFTELGLSDYIGREDDVYGDSEFNEKFYTGFKNEFPEADFRGKLGDDAKYGFDHWDAVRFERPDDPENPKRAEATAGYDINPNIEKFANESDIGKESAWWTPDIVNMVGAMTDDINKYYPVQGKIDMEPPGYVTLDPTRRLAANQEQMAQLYDFLENTAGAPGFAAALAASGQGFANAADIIGGVENTNVGIVNQALDKTSQVQNQENAVNEELRLKFNDQMATLNQQYDNARNQKKQKIINAFNTGFKNSVDTNWLTEMYPQYDVNTITGDIGFMGGRDVTNPYDPYSPANRNKTGYPQDPVSSANEYKAFMQTLMEDGSMTEETAGKLASSAFGNKNSRYPRGVYPFGSPQIGR